VLAVVVVVLACLMAWRMAPPDGGSLTARTALGIRSLSCYDSVTGCHLRRMGHAHNHPTIHIRWQRVHDRCRLTCRNSTRNDHSAPK
jgi:hypothetical protein